MTADRQRLKILFITSDKYPPHRPAARAIFGDELVKRGHVIDWLIQAEQSCEKPYLTHYGNGTAYIGATDDGFTKWQKLRKHLLDIFNDLRMFSMARRNKYDLLQVKDKYLGALLAIFAARMNRARFCFWLAYPHAEASLYSAKNGYAKYRVINYLKGKLYKFALYKIILPSADHVFVQSEQMKKDIAAEGIALEKMTPIPGSLNLDQIPYQPKQVLNSAEPKRLEKKIVYLGTLMRVRQLDFLIRVLATVLKKHPTAKLYMVGKGEHPKDDELLHSEVARLGIENAVVFTGYLPMQEAWEYVRNADVCVSPYFPTPILNSTSPTKLIEYMAMGKAVVGNDHPEQSLVINESGAGYCSPWSEDKFSESIIKLLDDPLLAKEMGGKGRRYVEKYRTNSRMVDIVENKYYELL